jgi:ribonuclease P protein component
MKRFGIHQSRRITAALDFARVYRTKVRASDRRLLVYAAPSPCGNTRFGLSVSKKLGGAVKRARLKRLLRESFRLSQHEMPAGLDLILIPQRETAGSFGLADYQQSLVELSRRLSNRLGLVPS